jgi:serine/threonine protein kinase
MDEATIFNLARRMPSPDQRGHYLDQACGGDSQLRARVEALLRIHDQDPSFLETPAVSRAAETDTLAEGPGKHIGPYKLLEQIGEGGFGVVYRAEQQHPLRRLVAFKILKPGMDTRQIVARFEAERQALALMDHPHIARVLDGDQTSSGRPYFVMELVQGIPITRYCDELQLTLRERLNLFTEVCQAVQHAHQKGIIHRDLKPSNVLVAAYDGKPVAKVIDFGVAKALGQKLTERTLVTEYGGIIGTLEYMSPEQTELDAVDIDTRADIYSLGVLLYELLTGTTPLTRERLKQVPILEALRLIREEDPPRPSARLRKEEGGRMKDESRRPRRTLWDRVLSFSSFILHPSSFEELDWIVMKALEKNRDRRYSTATALAEDVDRYLRHEAILARPPSLAYRLAKFGRRNRAAVLALTTIAAALLLGTAVAVWQAVVATRARNDAVSAFSAETEAKRQADAKEAETRAVLDFLETRVIKAARPEGEAGGQGASFTVRQALEAALPFVAKQFTEQPLTEARLRMTLGKSFQYLGDFKIAAEQFRIARTLYSQHRGLNDRDTLDSMDWLAESYRYSDKITEAFELQQETLARRKTHLGPDDPDTLRSMNNLAICYHAQGRTAESLQLNEETLARRQVQLGTDHPETLQSMNNVAALYNALGRHSDALPLHRKTLALMKNQHGANHPDTLVSMDNVGGTLLFLGRYAEAVGILEETLTRRKAQLSRNHPETLQSMSILATCYRCLGRHNEALEIIEKAISLQKEKLGSDHADTLQSQHNLACIRFALGQHTEALKLYEEVLALRKVKLGSAHPDVLGSIREMAGLRLHEFARTGDLAGCQAMAEMCEKLEPRDPASLYDVACYRAVTAAAFRARGKPSEATQADAEADRAMAWLKQAVAASYKEAAHLKDDKDLAALRSRADFRKLVSDLEAAADEQRKD